MGNTLNSISLAIGLMGSAHPSGPGPAAWKDYVWTESRYMRCLSKDSAGFCLTFRGRWDWKRDQWVDLAYKVDPSGKAIGVRLKLDNRDPQDDDNVCVTALFLDKKGRDVAVYHNNSHSDAQTAVVISDTLRVTARSLASVQKIVVGAKQCRGGPHEDDGIFFAAKKLTGQK